MDKLQYDFRARYRHRLVKPEDLVHLIRPLDRSRDKIVFEAADARDLLREHELLAAPLEFQLARTKAFFCCCHIAIKSQLPGDDPTVDGVATDQQYAEGEIGQ